MFQDWPKKIGTPRKSFIGRLTRRPESGRVLGTTASHLVLCVSLCLNEKRAGSETPPFDLICRVLAGDGYSFFSRSLAPTVKPSGAIIVGHVGVTQCAPERTRRGLYGCVTTLHGGTPVRPHPFV